jgi:hypothetical protein
MRRIPVNLQLHRLIPLLALAASAFSQGPGDITTLTVLAPQSWVLAAGTVSLDVSARDSFGSSVTGYVPGWVSRNPDLASVDANGVVTGIAPGVATIEADGPNGITATAAISVYPIRIDITPSPAEMFAGDTRAFSARAIDASGNAIAGVQFHWQTDVSGIATVDDAGTVRAAQQGRVSLLARVAAVDASYAATGLTILNVRRKPDYKVSRVLLSARGAATIRNLSYLSVSKNDKYAYIADLGTGAQAAVLVDNGVSTVLATTGTYIPEIGASAAQFLGTSVNSNGDVAVQIAHVAEWCTRSVVVFSKNGNRLADQTGSCVYQIVPRSMNDTGDIAVLHQTSTGARVISSFRADGSIVDVITQGDALAGIGHLINVNSVGSGEDGTVYFTGNGDNGSQGAFWWDGKTVRKLVATGEGYPGGVSALTQITDLKEASAGVFYILAHMGSNGSVALRSDSGALSVVVTNNQQIGSTTLYWIHGFLDARPAGVSFGIGSSDGDTYALRTASLAVVGVKTIGQWTDLQPTFVTSKGVLMTLQPGTSGARQLVQLDSSGRTVLISAGDSWSGDAPAGSGFEIISPNSTGDSVVVRAPGEVIYNVRAGVVTTALGAGDAISGLSPVTGFGSHRASANGTIALAAYRRGAEGYYVFRGGTLSKISEMYSQTDLLTDGRQLGNVVSWGDDYRTSINSSDQIATWCAAANSPGPSVCLIDPGAKTVRPVYNSRNAMSDGSVMTDIWSVGIDDSGRVLFYGPTATGVMLGIWDGRVARKVVASGEEALPGVRLAGVYRIQSAGGTFYFDAWFSSGLNRAILKYDGAKLTKILGDDNPALGFPANLNSFYGQEFAVNARGDVAYFAYSGQDRYLAVRKADGSDALVAISSDRSPENDWFIGFNGISLSDTGVVHFVSDVWNGGQRQIALHRAVPQ